jgi:hypothetical protein
MTMSGSAFTQAGQAPDGPPPENSESAIRIVGVAIASAEGGIDAIANDVQQDEVALLDSGRLSRRNDERVIG